MSNLVISGGRPILAAGLLALATAFTSFGGCDRPSPARMLVATSWPAIDRRRLESEFQGWVAASHGHLEHRRIRLEWLILEPDDDLVRLVQRRGQPDVLLGGSASSFARLARLDQLAPIDRAGSALLCVDPHGDAISLDWAISGLDHGRWREGYARLVQAAGSGRRISLHSGLASDDQGHNEAGRAGTLFEPPFPTRRIEFAAIPRTARNQESARGFLRFLAETQRVVPARAAAEIVAGVDPDAESMVADLFGATLFGAQDELWDAWALLERARDRDRALEWLTEPPPWPPASVAKYLRRDGEKAMSLIQTLAAELAPEPAARAWLLRSWLSPPRTVDDQLLVELAHAEEGRLGHEPRFRAWLREEWTAWARQRYRRVARLVAAEPRSASKGKVVRPAFVPVDKKTSTVAP
ncbi:MAG: hypothetical protein ACHRXM_09080 [Isosphaerales bacterium]